MSEHESSIVCLPNGTTADLLNKGKMKRVYSPLEQSIQIEIDPHHTIEKAKKDFGEWFLGAEDIEMMNEKCKAFEIDIEFEVPKVPFQYTEQDLERARSDKYLGKERFCVLRPSHAFITNDDGERERVPITANLLYQTFSDSYFGEEKIFQTDIIGRDLSSKSEHFQNEVLKSGYALATKGIVPETRSKSWEAQNKHMSRGEKRRTAVESVWDLTFTFVMRNKRLLSREYDWTSSDGDFSGEKKICVGYFDKSGMYFASIYTSSTNNNRGCCTSL